MNTRAAAARWADTWHRAWEALEVDPISALYAEDAVLTTQPFREVDRGRAGVAAYVGGAFADERAVRAWFGSPVVDGDRASVEWWAALLEDGAEVTLAGTSSLQFGSDGLVTAQRDTWNMAPGRREPPEGWGH
ncbi:MAG: nuclear transport factor 2 family protein [Chloroflexota bacterium]